MSKNAYHIVLEIVSTVASALLATLTRTLAEDGGGKGSDRPDNVER